MEAEEKRKASVEMQIFLSSQRIVSLIQRVLFMDQLFRVENKVLHSHSDTQHFIKLNLWACASCSSLRVLFILTCPVWTKRHSCSEAHQNGALPLNGYFHEAESVLCFFLSQLPWFNAFNAGWCFVRIVFNALHLPMNHKTIKTEKERNSENHYAFL